MESLKGGVGVSPKGKFSECDMSIKGRRMINGYHDEGEEERGILNSCASSLVLMLEGRGR